MKNLNNKCYLHNFEFKGIEKLHSRMLFVYFVVLFGGQQVNSYNKVIYEYAAAR